VSFRAIKLLGLFGGIAGLMLSLVARADAGFVLRQSPFVPEEAPYLQGAKFEPVLSAHQADQPQASAPKVAKSEPKQLVPPNTSRPPDHVGSLARSNRPPRTLQTASGSNAVPLAPGGIPCLPSYNRVPIAPGGLSNGGSAAGSSANGAGVGTSTSVSCIVPADCALPGIDLTGKLFLADERLNPPSFASQLFRPPRVV
jgi:hypothetical protein